jgi:hypothetical protein
LRPLPARPGFVRKSGARAHPTLVDWVGPWGRPEPRPGLPCPHPDLHLQPVRRWKPRWHGDERRLWRRHLQRLPARLRVPFELRLLEPSLLQRVQVSQ